MFSRLFGRSYSSTSAQGKQSSPETSSAIPPRLSGLHCDPKHSPSFVSASPELLHHLRDIVLPAPLPQDAFDPARHMRIVVAQDPFSHSARSPLFDSHLSRDPRTLRRNAFGSCSSTDSAEAGSYFSTTSDGSASSLATQEPSLLPGPPPESPSFYRLVDYMFGSVPMSYKGASVKMRSLNTTESSDRRSFLVTKLFSVSAREGPKVSYSSSAAIPDGVPVYPKIYVESESQSSFTRLDSNSSFLPAEHEWEPTPAPGDSLPFARSKGLFFAIGVIISIPRDYPSLLSANWTAFLRALDEFARVVHAELQSAVLSQAAQVRQCGSTMGGFSIPVTVQQLRLSPLTANESVRASALRFTTRFASGLSAPRVRCGISKWDVWREEARRLDDFLSSSENGCSTYLEAVLASFLGADTDWLETFGFVNPLFEGWRHKAIKIPPTRTIVAGDNNTAQRILYLLAAFLPAGTSRTPSVLHKSSPAASPGPGALASHKVSRGALDIPGGRQSLSVSMPLYDSHSNLHVSSSVTSYISSIWSQPSSVPTALTPSNMSAKDGSAISSDASISDAVSYSSSSAELDIDTDFFGPWDDVLGSPISIGGGSGLLPGNMTMTPSYDIRPRCSVTPGSGSGEAILDVAIPPRYADLRVPSLAISVNKGRPSSGVKFDLPQPTSTSISASLSSVDNTGISSFFHPEFKLQACTSIEEDASLVLRAIIEDAEYGQVPITLNAWTVVSRALVIDVDAKSVMVWNLLRRLSDDGCTLLQQVVKTMPVCGECNLARMWVDGRLSQESTPSYSQNLADREIVERVLSEIVDASGTQDLRMGINQMMLGPVIRDSAV
ncbi:hypothetical protein POJ06DRAFT_278865 [Lipomyces tetrasporus]|uniref:Folliculin-interacting protein N-terminal domain-containing protein n=1 Tax=Lipomyces tetrasporus TaxID=54092 RepID=A0AAD7QKT0_9ASCO|nr:uncharacterized protein POJ06DRAFT_278865 [Lipomyces tetrasporus]KAJ8096735.1 hypothetical protein POJ06DRAFT_278865 [Lipomyces tetrasporus]